MFVHLRVAKEELHRPQVAGLRYICATFVPRIEWVPYALGSRPMDVTQSRTWRAYWRVEMCGRSWNRPGQRCSDPTIVGASSHAPIAFRVPSVISKLTGRRVLL